MLSSHAMGDLFGQVARFARRHSLFPRGQAVVVGVSGGPDSLCLLHLLRRLAPELGLRLHVGHLNHGLRGAASAADSAFVAGVARDWGLSFHLGGADVPALAAAWSLSIEEAARQARYSFLATVAHELGAALIATGHTAGDQAETVLMHFLRGSGVAGLRGMLPRTALGEYRLLMGSWTLSAGNWQLAAGGPPAGRVLPDEEGEPDARGSPSPLYLVRPLLETTRDQVLGYCADQGLAPRFDVSNEDTTIYRNRLRHELLPLLESYNPAIRSVLAHTATVMAGDYEVLEVALEAAWERTARPSQAGEIRFDLAAWRALPLGLQRALVRRGVRRLRSTLRNVNWEHVERAVWLAREGETGQSATLTAGLALEIGYDQLRIAGEDKPWPVPAAQVPQLAGAVTLAAPGRTPLGDGWWATVRRVETGSSAAEQVPREDPWLAWLDAAAIGTGMILRPRLPGERFQPQGLAGHSIKLGELMTNLKVPRSARAGWPLLVAARGIAWVCGLRVADWATIGPQTRAVWEVSLARDL